MLRVEECGVRNSVQCTYHLFINDTLQRKKKSCKRWSRNSSRSFEIRKSIKESRQLCTVGDTVKLLLEPKIHRR